MRFLEPFLKILNGLWNWLRKAPHVGSLSLLVAVGVMLIAQMVGYHQDRLPWMPGHGTDLMKGWMAPSAPLLAFYYLMPYLKLWALLGGIVYHVALVRALPNVEKLKWPTWIACSF